MTSRKVSEPERTLKADDFKIGDYILLTKERAGVIKYIGDVHYEKGTHFGVELIGSLGKHSGTWRGKQYFACETDRGMLVAMDRVRKKLSKKDIEEDKEGKFAKMGLSSRNLGVEKSEVEVKKENKLLLDAQEWDGKEVSVYVNKQIAQDGEHFKDLNGPQFLALFANPDEMKKRTRKFKKLRKFMRADFFPEETQKNENSKITQEKVTVTAPDEEGKDEKDETPSALPTQDDSNKTRLVYKAKRAQKKDRISVDLGNSGLKTLTRKG